MTFHIVLGRPSHLAEVAKGAKEGFNPRHSMIELAEELNAVVHDGTGLSTRSIDRILGQISRTDPLWWAIARDVRSKVVRGDVVFCTGEDIGLPVALRCGGRRGARVAVMAHNVDSVKKRFALTLFRAKAKVSLFMVVCKTQAALLRSHMGSRASRVEFVWDQTDTRFFSPGVKACEKSRPTVMSIGLEQRDYTTLAAATRDLDLDVRISGYSADTRVVSRAFPEVMPTNMSRRFYEWPDLLQLYRDADVVAISLFPNSYAAGVQGLMEALACGRPVVVTATAGLAEYLEPGDAMYVIEPGDAHALRRAIVDLLGDPAERERLSAAALGRTIERHTCESYVRTLAENLRALGARPAAGG